MKSLGFLNILLLLIATENCNAQGEAYIWYFADSIGLDFNFTPPRLLTNGKLTGYFWGDGESASSISDQNGNLLFYTDGVTVWDKDHQTMPNGLELWGTGTTTQTIIAPNPERNNIYYIFTASPQGDDEVFSFPKERKGFRYTVVDMSLRNGMGDVVDKNILLNHSTTEKIAATLHVNGKDIWIVMHEWNNDIFKSYLITGNGVSQTPVLSKTGMVHSGGPIEGQYYSANAIGQMKISPDGEKLALVLYEKKNAEVFFFNSYSGEVALRESILNFKYNLYGVEFSPNSQLLYIGDNVKYLYQYDLTGNNISQSETKIEDNTFSFFDWPSSLQQAPDGKIYIAKYGMNFLGVINYPNKRGLECDYQSQAISLVDNGQFFQCRQGLPNFISSYFYDPKSDPPLPFFEMPNVFTPNDDNLNSAFVPSLFYNVSFARINIYNRWGKLINQVEDLEKGWNGENQSSGVYYWYAQYEGVNGKLYTKKGFVHLLR